MIGTAEERLKELNERYPVWEPRTLWERLRESARLFSNNEFVVFEDAVYTYAQAMEETERMAQRLWELGVRPKDHVCLFMSNCPEHIFLIFALSRLGAVEVAGNIKIAAQELKHILALTDARFLICNTALPNSYVPELDFAGTVVEVAREDPASLGCRAVSWEQFLGSSGTEFSSEQDEALLQAQDANALSAIFFTSGSTTCPKGVMITHDMILRSAYGTCLCRRMEWGRRLCVPLPLFHIMAYSEGMLSALFVGGAVIMTTERRFSPGHILWLMRQFRANDLICMSSMMISMLTKCTPCAEDYPKMHSAYWASACPDWVWDAGRSAFGICDISTAYGTTECGSTVVMLSPEDGPDRVKQCHGRVKPAGCAAVPLLGDVQVEVGVFDLDTNELLPPGRQGELRCRGATVTKGYYKEPEETEKALTPDGWFCTGDLGTMDADGYFTFMGRQDDMYKINGENVSPMFLDMVIGQCPLVRAVETVGIPNPKHGAVGAAFIDLKESSQEAEAQVRAYCRAHLASFQIPKYFFISDCSTWPRTGSGKVQKAALREIAERELANMSADG